MFMQEDIAMEVIEVVKATILKVTNEDDSSKNPLPVAMDEIQFVQQKDMVDHSWNDEVIFDQMLYRNISEKHIFLILLPFFA